MNDWTFLFVLCSHMIVLPRDDQSRPAHQEIFLVRWRSKHTYATMRKNARKVVAAHVVKRIQAGEFVMQAYASNYVIDNLREHIRFVEPLNHSVRSFPKFTRIDQPEEYK